MSFGEAKKREWYEKLANPDIPLHEITQVQHQMKTAESIDVMFANKIPVDRACWYIRALGAIEIVCACYSLPYHCLTMIASQK